MNPDPLTVTEDTDDEPWAVPDDDLAPARGLLLGLAIGGFIWAVLIAVIAWRVMR